MGLPAAEVARRAGARAELVQELTDRGLTVAEEDGNLPERVPEPVPLFRARPR